MTLNEATVWELAASNLFWQALLDGKEVRLVGTMDQIKAKVRNFGLHKAWWRRGCYVGGGVTVQIAESFFDTSTGVPPSLFYYWTKLDMRRLDGREVSAFLPLFAAGTDSVSDLTTR